MGRWGGVGWGRGGRFCLNQVECASTITCSTAQCMLMVWTESHHAVNLSSLCGDAVVSWCRAYGQPRYFASWHRVLQRGEKCIATVFYALNVVTVTSSRSSTSSHIRPPHHSLKHDLENSFPSMLHSVHPAGNGRFKGLRTDGLRTDGLRRDSV